MNRYILSLTALALAVATSSAAAQSASAKAAYYNSLGQVQVTERNHDGTAPASGGPRAERGPAPVAGVAYWIDRSANGQQPVRMTVDQVFDSGDRIQLNFQPNMSGYLYVFNKGTTGTTRLIYPAEGDNNRVKAGRKYTVPGKGSKWVLDRNPGEEQLAVILSRKPLGQIVPALRDRSISNPESPGLLAVMDTKSFDASTKAAVSKDIRLEHDARPSDRQQAASYAVAPLGSVEAGALLGFAIRIQHR